MTSETPLCPHESRQIEAADFYNCIFQVIVQWRQVYVDAEKCGTQEWRREDALVIAITTLSRKKVWKVATQSRRLWGWGVAAKSGGTLTETAFVKHLLCKTSERGTQSICFSLWFLPAQNYDELWDRVKLKPHCMPVSTQNLFWLKSNYVCIWFCSHKWKVRFIVCGAILFYCFCYTSGINQNSSMHIWQQGKDNTFQ